MQGYGTSGTTHDFFCYNASNAVWNGTAFETWSAGSYTTYRVAATELSGSGAFSGTLPTNAVSYELRERGASLALSYIRTFYKPSNSTVAFGVTGTSYDFFFYNSSNQVWNGSAFTTWVAGSYTSYRVAATELSGSGRFYCSTSVPQLTTRYELRERSGTLANSLIVYVGEYAYVTPSTRTGYLVCYDENGDVESGVSVSIQCYYAPDSGLALDSKPRVGTSDADGYVEFDNLFVGAKYKYSRNGRSEVKITIPSGSTGVALNSIVGKD